MSFFLRRYKQILRFFPLLFYLQFPWGKRWSFDGWNFKNFRTKARWGTATWSTSWDVVASWSLATMRSCFLDFAAKDVFRWKFPTLWRWNTCVVMKPGFSLFRENLKKQTNFPGDVLWLASFLQLPPQSGRMSKFLAGSWERLVVEILRMHTYTETLTWCTKWTADVSQKQKALNNGTKVSHGLFTSWSWYCKVLL